MNIKQALSLQVVAVLLIFFLGVREVRAEVVFNTRSEAYAACQKDTALLMGRLDSAWAPANCRYKTDYGRPMYVCEAQHIERRWFRFCTPWGEDKSATWEYRWLNEDPECTDYQVLNEYTGKCQKQCIVGEERINHSAIVPAGSFVCRGGCKWVHYPNWNGESDAIATGGMCSDWFLEEDCKNTPGYYWDPPSFGEGQGWCITFEPQCPEGQKEENGNCVIDGGCLPSEIEVVVVRPSGAEIQCKKADSECPAGMLNISGECETTENSCPMGQKSGPDGTCKWIAEDPEKDSASDDGNRFSGGDDCNVPPSCSGDPILCGQSRIQWRIECNTRKNRNITGGTCDRPPLCTGDKCDAMEFSSLIMQWRSACALEKLATTDTRNNEDSNWRAEEVAGLQALGTDTGPPVDESSIWHVHENTELKTNLFGAQNVNQCATGFTLLGHDIEMGPDWWNLASMIGWLIVSCTYLWVALRLGG